MNLVEALAEAAKRDPRKVEPPEFVAERDFEFVGMVPMELRGLVYIRGELIAIAEEAAAERDNQPLITPANDRRAALAAIRCNAVDTLVAARLQEAYPDKLIPFGPEAKIPVKICQDWGIYVMKS